MSKDSAGKGKKYSIFADEVLYKEQIVLDMHWDIIPIIDGQHWMVQAKSIARAPDRCPPKIAEFLLAVLLRPSRADAVVGDLNERFDGAVEKFGRHRSARMYWGWTLRSLWPLLGRAIGKALKWGAVIATVRRLF